jgi:hypothetical protein
VPWALLDRIGPLEVGVTVEADEGLARIDARPSRPLGDAAAIARVTQDFLVAVDHVVAFDPEGPLEPAEVDRLQRYLDHPDELVRFRAAVRLGRADRVREVALDPAGSDRVRCEAARWLRIGFPAHVPALARAFLESGRPALVRVGGFFAYVQGLLGELPVPKAIAELAPDSLDEIDALDLALELARRGPAAKGELLALTRFSSRQVRSRAVAALQAMGWDPTQERGNLAVSELRAASGALSASEGGGELSHGAAGGELSEKEE